MLDGLLDGGLLWRGLGNVSPSIASGGDAWSGADDSGGGNQGGRGQAVLAALAQGVPDGGGCEGAHVGQWHTAETVMVTARRVAAVEIDKIDLEGLPNRAEGYL